MDGWTDGQTGGHLVDGLLDVSQKPPTREAHEAVSGGGDSAPHHTLADHQQGGQPPRDGIAAPGGRGSSPPPAPFLHPRQM